MDLSEDKSERVVSSHCDKLGSHHKPDYDQVREKKASCCFLILTHFHRNHFPLTVGVSATAPPQIWVKMKRTGHVVNDNSLYNICEANMAVDNHPSTQESPLKALKDTQRTKRSFYVWPLVMLFKQCLYTTCWSVCLPWEFRFWYLCIIIVILQGRPVEILPFLYLGSAYHACRQDYLSDLCITALLNVSRRDSRPAKGQFDYKWIPVEDSHTADISSHFQEAIDFIGKYCVCSMNIYCLILYIYIYKMSTSLMLCKLHTYG